MHFKNMFTRTFPLNLLIDIPELVYMHDDTKQVISTHGNGFMSTLQTAQYHDFVWSISPDDVWLHALQQIIPIQHENVDIKSHGLVYEQCINQLFHMVPCPYKHIFDLDFSTSTYASRMAAKVAYLSHFIHQQPYSFSPIINDFKNPIITTKGTKEDWDKIRYMTEHTDIIPEHFKDFLFQPSSFKALQNLYKSSSSHSGITGFKTDTNMQVFSGFIGAVLNNTEGSVSPNITWYIANSKDQQNISRVSFKYRTSSFQNN